MLALGKSGDGAYEMTITDLYMGSLHFCVIDSSVYLQGCIQDFFLGGEVGGRGDLTDNLRMYMRRCHAYILVNK